MFKYQTGEDIILGDVVQYAEWQGIIEFFIHKGTSLAIDYHAPKGGVMILFFNGGRLLLENTKEEEDLIFKRRFDNSVITEFEKRKKICTLLYHNGIPISVGDEVECIGPLKEQTRMQISSIYPPFTSISWQARMPTGGFTCMLPTGEELTFETVPPSMRLIC